MASVVYPPTLALADIRRASRRTLVDESNGRVMRRAFEEIMARGNVAIIDELFTCDFAGHDTAGGTFGRDEFRAGVLAMLSAFSDRQVVIADQVVNGDKVATRWQARAVHTGEFNRIPGTGRAVTLTGISIDRIVAGKIVESWEITDDAGLLRQLGVLSSA
jgi:predicted ester cyclase